MTSLDKPLRREVLVDDTACTLTLHPQGLKLVPKDRRRGLQLAWSDLLNGDAAPAIALQAPMQAGPR